MSVAGLIHVYHLAHDKEQIERVQHATLHTVEFGLVPEHGLFGSPSWWAAVQSGMIRLEVIDGRISRVYKSGHNDYEQFDVDDGHDRTHWAQVTSVTSDSELTRAQKARLYRVGAPVHLAYVNLRFKKALEGVGPHCKILVDIWIAPTDPGAPKS